MRVAAAEEPISKLAHTLDRNDPKCSYARLIEEHYHRLYQPQADCCVFDRSLLDMVVYMNTRSDNPDCMASLTRELLKWYKHYFQLWFYTPIEFPMPRHAARPEDEALRDSLDADIRAQAAAYGIPLIELRGDLETRVRNAQAFVMDHLHRPTPEPAAGAGP